MPRARQRLFDQAALDSILAQTGCTIELSPDDQSEYLTILGPAIALPQALTTVMAMHSDVPTQSVDMRGRGDASHGSAVLRFLIGRQRVKQLAKENQVQMFTPSEKAILDGSSSLQIDVVGQMPADPNLIKAVQALKALEAELTPVTLATVPVDHLLHQVLQGKKYVSLCSGHLLRLMSAGPKILRPPIRRSSSSHLLPIMSQQ